jgi:hypothetical protein
MSVEGEEIVESAPKEKGSEGAMRSPPAPDDSAQLREATEAIIKLRKLIDTAEIIEREGKEYVMLNKHALFEVLRDLKKLNAILRDIAFRAKTIRKIKTIKEAETLAKKRRSCRLLKKVMSIPSI